MEYFDRSVSVGRGRVALHMVACETIDHLHKFQKRVLVGGKSELREMGTSLTSVGSKDRPYLEVVYFL